MKAFMCASGKEPTGRCRGTWEMQAPSWGWVDPWVGNSNPAVFLTRELMDREAW